MKGLVIDGNQVETSGGAISSSSQPGSWLAWISQGHPPSPEYRRVHAENVNVYRVLRVGVCSTSQPGSWLAWMSQGDLWRGLSLWPWRGIQPIALSQCGNDERHLHHCEGVPNALTGIAYEEKVGEWCECLRLF